MGYGRIHCFTTNCFVPSDWKYNSGFINDTMVKDHLPAPGVGTLVLVCGPPLMIDFASTYCLYNLDKLRYTPDLKFSYKTSEL